MSFVSKIHSDGLLKGSANYLTSFMESDSDSEGFESIESAQTDDFQDTESYHIPIHFLHIPAIHAPLGSMPPAIPLVPVTSESIAHSPNGRPSHLCQSRNGEYFLRCIQESRCKLVTISSRGMFLLQESPPNPIGGALRSLISKAESIALNTMGEFQQLCKENMNPVSGKKRPVSAELESVWCKISQSVTDLLRRFDEVDDLYDENGWKESSD